MTYVLVALVTMNLISLALVGFLVTKLVQHPAAVAAVVTSLVDRLERTPNVVIRAAEPNLPPRASEKTYITELSYDDASWNDFVGVEPEDDQVSA